MLAESYALRQREEFRDGRRGPARPVENARREFGRRFGWAATEPGQRGGIFERLPRGNHGIAGVACGRENGDGRSESGLEYLCVGFDYDIGVGAELHRGSRNTRLPALHEPSKCKPQQAKQHE